MNIFLLGATGSIGTQTLDIIRLYPQEFKLVSCSLGRDIKKGMEIIDEFAPKCVCLRDDSFLQSMKEQYPTIDFYTGDEGLVQVACYNAGEKGILVNAVMGSVGLVPTVEAIKAGHDIAIANKETLVVAGQIVVDLARKNHVRLLPIDSEHSAIMQCIGEKKEEVKRIVITSSGGSFRDYTREQLSHVTKADALRHPNWNMGEKITIDSATMMNKGLEVIEAHFLFDIPYERIDTILHRESVVHSMVEFVDSSVIAQLGTPDMRLPILHALGHPRRLAYDSPLDLKEIGTMHFENLDLQRFPCLEMAYNAGKAGGIMPVVLNAANEAAVSLFLNEKISFLMIEEIVRMELQATKNIENPSLDVILNYDRMVKERIMSKYGGMR